MAESPPAGTVPVAPERSGRVPSSAAPVTAESRIQLRDLTFRPEGTGFIVGDPARGEFAEMPALAVAVIRALMAGLTVAEAADIACDGASGGADVAQFAQELLELGFVAGIDGVPVPLASPEMTGGGRPGAILARLARPLYSSPAWWLYALLFTGCVALLAAAPSFRPRYGQLFFLSNPVLSVALLTIIMAPLAALHELAHWLGARIEGLPARITISRRWYWLVLQTDLSALWALPRRRRFRPLLAGMAFDTVLTSALLAARAAQLAGWWHLGPVPARLLTAMVLALVFGMSFQFMVFMRTDLYAVLVTGLGYQNLTRVSRLRMARMYRHLTPAEKRELHGAAPRDKAAARWYGWVQLAGAGLAGFYFVAFFAPAITHMVWWITTGLAHMSPATFGFWTVLASGCIALLPAAIPPFTYLRDHGWRGTGRTRART